MASNFNQLRQVVRDYFYDTKRDADTTRRDLEDLRDEIDTLLNSMEPRHD